MTLNEDDNFETMFEKAPDVGTGSGWPEGDPTESTDEPGYGIDMAPHQRDKKEAEEEFNRLTTAEAAEASTAPVSVPGEVKAQPLAPVPAPTPKTSDSMTFGQAFKAARTEGLSTFEWKGKKFTTQLKEEVAAPAKSQAVPRPPANKVSSPAATAPSVQPPATMPKSAIVQPPTADAALARAGQPAAKAQLAPVSVSTGSVATPATPTAATADPVTVTPSRHAQESFPGASPTAMRVHRLRTQKAYDDWQEAKSANSTWYGGKAVMRPGMAEREKEAEQRYLQLLRTPK